MNNKHHLKKIMKNILQGNSIEIHKRSKMYQQNRQVQLGGKHAFLYRIGKHAFYSNNWSGR